MTRIYRRHPAPQTRASELRQFALSLSLLLTVWSAWIALGAAILASAETNATYSHAAVTMLKCLSVCALAYLALRLLHQRDVTE